MTTETAMQLPPTVNRCPDCDPPMTIEIKYEYKPADLCKYAAFTTFAGQTIYRVAGSYQEAKQLVLETVAAIQRERVPEPEQVTL